MTGVPTIATNVDIFSDNDGYFVRTEIETRIVSIHGPVGDLVTAQKQQAAQLAHLKAACAALEEQLQRAASPAE